MTEDAITEVRAQAVRAGGEIITLAEGTWRLHEGQSSSSGSATEDPTPTPTAAAAASGVEAEGAGMTYLCVLIVEFQ